MDWKCSYTTTHESTLSLQKACQAYLLEVEDVGVVPSDEGQRIRMMVKRELETLFPNKHVRLGLAYIRLGIVVAFVWGLWRFVLDGFGDCAGGCSLDCLGNG